MPVRSPDTPGGHGDFPGRVMTVGQSRAESRNVLGEPLKPCSMNPMTGFYRDGCCNTGTDDFGRHTVCCQVTDEFLEFSRSRGNDLSSPRPEFGFPGLKEGDRWCLCADRWVEAFQFDAAPRILLECTHESALETISFATLRRFALDMN